MGSGSYSNREFQNANPYSDPTMKMLQNNTNQNKAGMEGALANLTGTGAGSAWGNFMGVQPELQGLVMGASSPLQQMLDKQSQYNITRGVNQAGQQMSGLGAKYSGAMLDAGNRVGAESGANVAAALGGQQLGLYGSLAGQSMGNLFQGAGQAAQQYGNLYGQGMQLQAGLSTPDMVEKKHNAGFFEPGGLGSQLGGAALGLGGAMLGGPMGGMIGSGLGKMFSGGGSPTATLEGGSYGRNFDPAELGMGGMGGGGNSFGQGIMNRMVMPNMYPSYNEYNSMDSPYLNYRFRPPINANPSGLDYGSYSY